MKQPTAKLPPIKLSDGADPPTEFRMFRMGENPTEKGTFLLDADDAEACLDAQAAYGNDLSIDWGHGAFEEANGKPQPAAGWIGGLELRPDGLWAVQVTWTELAAGMIRRREQRYFSPAFETDEKGHIRKVLNVALTLIPATHNLIPLVASRHGGRNPAPTRKLNMADKYCKASELTALADEIEKNEKASDSDKEMAKRLRKLAEDGEEMGEKKKETTSDDDEEGDDKDKSEKQAASRLGKLAMDLTGKKDPAAAAGALQAWKESHGDVAKLSKQVAELTAGNRKAEVDAEIAKASRAGKVTPAMFKSGRLQRMGMRDLEELKGFIEEMPVVVSMNDGNPVELNSGDPEKAGNLVPSAEQKKILVELGVDLNDKNAVRAILSGMQR